MNNIKFNQSGGFPLSTNTLNAMQENYDLYHNYKHLAGDNCILSGCEVRGATITNGVIVLKGELLPFVGALGDFNSNVIVKEEVENKAFEDTSIKQVYHKRFATLGSGEGAVALSSLTRIKPLIEMAKSLVPVGMISMWSGKLTELPKGWYLCDGTKNTPDLRDRFIVGSGGKYTTSNIGGLDEVTLTEAQMPKHTHSGKTDYGGSHSHEYQDSYFIESGGYQAVKGKKELTNVWASRGDGGMKVMKSPTIYYQDGFIIDSGNHTHNLTIKESGSNQAHENRPPYYALAFIIYKGE